MNLKRTIILIILIIVLSFVFLLWKGYQVSREEGLSISIFKEKYEAGENPRVEIKNESQQTICFSSCYPYLLQKENGSLESYDYSKCPYPDVSESCIKSGGIKFFNLILDKMEIKGGLHKIAVPACIGCALEENFRNDKLFYSNEFIITSY